MFRVLSSYLVALKNSNPWLLLLWHVLLHQRSKREIRKYTDKEAVDRLYHNFSGRYPDIENPVLFSEKQQWLKLKYRDDLMPICVDKLEVRRFLKDKGYANHLNEILAVYENIDEFNIDILPNRFVLKATHGSGWNLVCKDKLKINWFVWRKIMKCWLESNIFWEGREWPYKDITPRIICEKYLEDENGQLIDYKFFCFNGKPRFIQANQGRGTSRHAQNFFDLNWRILPFGKDLIPKPEIRIPQPKNLAHMISIAKNLSVDFSFVRVDLYEVMSEVFIGELTFFPASGMPDFVPEKYDEIVGDMWTLPKNNMH